ncbi:haloacid dehalogenase-like hydrolase, partial [Rhizobium ruizarguesonis]
MFAIQDLIKSARGGTLAVTAALLFVDSAYAQSDPLPSWNDTA